MVLQKQWMQFEQYRGVILFNEGQKKTFFFTERHRPDLTVQYNIKSIWPVLAMREMKLLKP